MICFFYKTCKLSAVIIANKKQSWCY